MKTTSQPGSSTCNACSGTGSYIPTITNPGGSTRSGPRQQCGDCRGTGRV